MPLKTRTIKDVEVMAMGRWHGTGCPEAGCVFDAKTLDGIAAANAAIGDRLHPPVKLGHTDDQKLLQDGGYNAAGYVSNLRRVNNKLLADLEAVPEKIAQLMEVGAWRTRSVELDPDMEFDGVTYPLVLTGLALLGDELPAVQTLDDIYELYDAVELSRPKSNKTRAYLFALPPDMSYQQISELVTRAAVDQMPGIFGNEEQMVWCVDLFDTYAVISAGIDYYQVNYSFDEQDNIIFEGQPVEVERVSRWVPAIGLALRRFGVEQEYDSTDYASVLETIIERLDTKLKGKKGITSMRTLLRETLAKLKKMGAAPAQMEGKNVDEKKVRALLGLADDADLEAAITDLHARATAKPATGAPGMTETERAELSDARQRVITLETQIAADKANRQLDDLIRLGKIAPASRETALALALTDGERFTAFMAAQKPVITFGAKGSDSTGENDDPAGIAELEPDAEAVKIAMQASGKDKAGARKMLVEQKARDLGRDLAADWDKAAEHVKA